MRVLSRADGMDFVGIISISAILGRTVFVVNIECHIVPIEDSFLCLFQRRSVQLKIKDLKHRTYKYVFLFINNRIYYT